MIIKASHRKARRWGKNQVKEHYAVLENEHMKLAETGDGVACWDS